MFFCLALVFSSTANANDRIRRYAEPALMCSIAAGTGLGAAYTRDWVSRFILGLFAAFTTVTCGTHIVLAAPETPLDPRFQSLLRQLSIEPSSAAAEDLYIDLREGVATRELIQRYVSDPSLRERLLNEIN